MSEASNLSLQPSDFPEDDEISLLDLLQVVANNLRLLVLGPLVVGLAALGVSFAIAPSFVATTKFLPPQQQQSSAASMLASLGALGGLAGAATGLKSPADQYIAFLKSRSVQDALVDRFKLLDYYEVKLRDDARLALSANAQVASGKDGLITIDFTDKDPVFAAHLANAHVEELGKLLNRIAVTEAQQRRAFFDKQLKQTKDNLTAAQQALNAVGVNVSVLKSNPVAAVEGLAKLRAAITAQEIKLASMRGYLAESAPDFKQAQTELAALRAQVSSAEKSDAAASTEGSDYITRYREYKYQETLFELFAKQYEIARVDESREGAVIQVLDIAQPPERKAKPKKAMIAVIATLASGFALLLFVFVRQALRNAQGNQESAVKLAQLRASFRRGIGRG
jgi:uncharacterized protein involved in exopolysaccharide biosynthesis